MQLKHTYLKLILCAILFSAVSAQGIVRGRHAALDSHQIYAGGRLGVGIPLSLGRSSDEIAFNDVASIGFACKADVMWLASPAICLGGELGFNKFPYKEQFWATLGQRGSFDANYRELSAGVLGRLVMGTYDVKPFLGIAVDAHLLMNELTFDSRFDGTMQDESVKYKLTQIKPGFGVETGIFFRAGDNTQLSVAVRLNVLPFLDEEKMTTVDKDTFQESSVIVNPHGNQNNIEVLVGLHFRTKSDRKLKKH